MRLSVMALLLLLDSLVLMFGAQALRGAKEHKDFNKRNRKKLWLTVSSTFMDHHDVPPLSQAANQSLSPWSYEYTSDHTCIPNIMFEARCEKMGCMSANGHQNLEAKPILYQIQVLRKTWRKKRYFYQVEQKSISVGCTCVRPTIIHHQLHH